MDDKKRRALELLVAMGAAQNLGDCDYTRKRQGNNHGGLIPCMVCGRPTEQIDNAGLGDSSGLCPKCYRERYGR